MDHPSEYTLTREEWLAVNRALAGARLSMWFSCEERGRFERVGEAQDILSTSYARSKEQMKCLG